MVTIENIVADLSSNEEDLKLESFQVPGAHIHTLTLHTHIHITHTYLYSYSYPYPCYTQLFDAYSSPKVTYDEKQRAYKCVPHSPHVISDIDQR
ncbi:hypothetical protein EON63_02295 [archaeon]|nr:MAG: hypothetical protein EON63_02295 [archaeon]